MVREEARYLLWIQGMKCPIQVLANPFASGSEILEWNLWVPQ